MSNFTPTPGELNLANAIFTQGDPNKVGILTGDVAVRIFGGAKLPPQSLGQIWALADHENNGWLSKKGVAIAVRLMGHAQHGERIDKALISKPGPLPNIEGISPIVPQSTGSALKPPPSLSPQDRAKFTNMFLKAGPVNGLLSGDKARDIFIKSKLPNDKLLQIWNLADTQDRGALDATDFAIGMYFIQAVMSGTLSFIPTSLPPGLYQQASGTPAPIPAHSTGGSSSNFAPSPVGSSFPQHRTGIQPQYTGSMLQSDNTGLSLTNRPAPLPPQLPNRPTVAAAVGASSFAQTAHTAHWDVTPAEKAQSDGIFNNLDASHKGYIEGDVAVPFMLESKLPEDDLAQIWDLADLNNDGRLTQYGFAVAMHLIQNKLKGIPIPTTLPHSLIPPPMRTSSFPSFPTQTQSQSPPPSSEPQHDLFSWDEPVHVPTPPVSSHMTGTQSTVVSHPTGQLSQQITGTLSNSMSSYSAPRSDQFASASFSPGRNLLDDDDTVSSDPIEDRSAEIGNIQNQLTSTNRSLETSKKERATTEQDVTSQAAQLASLQTQLSSAKAAYETEAKLLSNLRERHSTQTSEIAKTREELIRAESDLSGLRVEKAEIEGAFLRDKEEARELHRKMVEAGQQADAIRADMEKLKKDAKQQKGRLAIAKKQLGVKEADRLKAQNEFEEAQGELASVTAEADATEADLAKLDQPSMSAVPPAPQPVRAFSDDSTIFAAAQPLPATPDPQSPYNLPGTPKSNNPFERLAKGSNPNSRSSSPFRSMSTDGPGLAGNMPTDAPSDAPADTKADQSFNFDDAFSGFAGAAPNGHAQSGTSNTGPDDTAVSEPPVDLLNTSNGSTMGSLVSPVSATDADHFMTPPSTAAVAKTPERSFTDVAEAFPDLDAKTSPVASPSVDEGMSFPGAFPDSPSDGGGKVAKGDDTHVTDLNSNLKELEIEEPDSSDDEDDNTPLSTLAKSKPSAAPVPQPGNPSVANGNANAVQPSFDDIFNAPSSPVPATKGPPPTTNGTTKTNNEDAFVPSGTVSSPSTVPQFSSNDLFNSSLVKSASSPAGVDAFDEAMGLSKPKEKGATELPAFSFDTAFDDNFDFASAVVTETTPPTVVTPPNGGAKPATAPGFEDLFDAPASEQASGVKANDTSSPITVAAASPTFNQALGSLDNTAPQDRPSSKSPPPATQPTPTIGSVVATTPPAAAAPKPFDSPSSTHGNHRPTQSSSSGRSNSPAPRASSPTMLRASPPEKAKDAHRTSKLSIRLPFGRKKKHTLEPIPAVPETHLSPPTEEPTLRQATPANEDDVEPVRQLTAMGFSRSQAVEALEKHSYDVPRALNSLLGQ